MMSTKKEMLVSLFINASLLTIIVSMSAEKKEIIVGTKLKLDPRFSVSAIIIPGKMQIGI